MFFTRRAPEVKTPRTGHRSLAVLLLGLSLLAPTVLQAISCYSELGLVRDVKPEHLVNQARGIVQRLEAVGAPLDPWELQTLERAFITSVCD